MPFLRTNTVRCGLRPTKTDIIQRLTTHRGIVSPLEARPRAQLVLCIDVRSESFRPHVGID